MKRAVILGYGNMGSLYAGKIYRGEIEGLQLYGIVCRNPQRREELSREMPGVVTYGNEEDMFRDSESFDAVIITTPHREHVRAVGRARAAGLHVLCEKPLGVSAGECADGLEEPDGGMSSADTCCAESWGSRNQNTVCAMVFHWRAKEIYRQAKKILEEGRLGRLHTAVWTANFWFRPEYYHRLSSWRSSWKGEGGGLLINQCQHSLDMWNWLFGQPSQVYARIGYGVYSDITVDDRVSLLFSHSNGLEGTLLSSTGDSPGSNRLEIHGEMGKLILEDERTLVLCRNERSTSQVSRTARQANPVIPYTEERWEIVQEKEEYEAVLQNFADVMHGKAEPLAGLMDGMRALQNANAAYLSDWKQQTMAIPCSPGEYLRGLMERQEKEAGKEARSEIR